MAPVVVGAASRTARPPRARPASAVETLHRQHPEDRGALIGRGGEVDGRRDPPVVIAGRVGDEFESLGALADSSRRTAGSLARIEDALVHSAEPDPQLLEIRRGLDRATAAIESLAGSWASAYEKSSRTTQEQLAKTMSSLKDALEMINVSIEQGNSLYKNIVKRMFDDRNGGSRSSDSVRGAA